MVIVCEKGERERERLCKGNCVCVREIQTQKKRSNQRQKERQSCAKMRCSHVLPLADLRHSLKRQLTTGSRGQF